MTYASAVRIARQGDILIARLDALPAGLRPAPRDGLGRIVLARGELHDHTHAIRSPNVCAFCLFDAEDVEWIEVGGSSAVLNHEYSSGAMAEHAPVSLEPGVYRIVRQREYVASNVVRRVAD